MSTFQSKIKLWCICILWIIAGSSAIHCCAL